MNPYVAQAIGLTLQQELARRGGDGLRQRQMNILNMDAERKKLEEILLDSQWKRQERAKQLAAEQAKVDAAAEIATKQEALRAKTLRGLKKRETVVPDVGDYWQGIATAVEAADPSLVDPSAPDGVVDFGNLVDKMGPERAAAFYARLEAAKPGEVDSVVGEVNKAAYPSPKQTNPRHSFWKELLVPKVLEAPTKESGYVQAPSKFQLMTDEDVKNYARMQGVSVSQEEIDELRKANGPAPKQSLPGSPATNSGVPIGEGKTLIDYKPGDADAEWDANIMARIEAARKGDNFPILPPNVPMPKGYLPKGMIPPAGVERGSDAWQKAVNDYIQGEIERARKEGSASGAKYETSKTVAEKSASFILNGSGDQARDNEFAKLKGDTKAWESLPPDVQAALEQKVAVLKARMAGKANKENKPKGWEGMTLESQEAKRKAWRDLNAKIVSIDKAYHPAKRNNESHIRIGKDRYSLEDAWAMRSALWRDLLAMEAAYGYDNLWQNSGVKYSEKRGKKKPKNETKKEPPLKPAVDPIFIQMQKSNPGGY